MAAIGLCSQRLPDVAKTCLEGLLALALSGNHHFFARGSLLIGASIFLYPLLVFSFPYWQLYGSDIDITESSNKNGASADEEAVLVQAINSIKTIIKQDPPSHEKVYFPYFLLCWSIFMHVSDDIYLNLNFPDILSLSHKMCSSKKICNVINSMWETMFHGCGLWKKYICFLIVLYFSWSSISNTDASSRIADQFEYLFLYTVMISVTYGEMPDCTL